MNDTPMNDSTRREFINTTGRVAATTTIAGLAVPNVYAAENNTIRVVLVGCGGRGTGAAADALSVKYGPIKLVAMADVFPNRLQASHNTLSRKFKPDQFDVPKERQFIGFDAYKKAMDCLNPGDIAIFTTPLTFRWVHFTYAIKKKLNVFMEKPLTADGPTSRRMIELSKQADANNLKVGVGLMSRHSRAMEEAYSRIQAGEIGDIISMRGYRMHGPGGSAFSEKWNGQGSELMWQISRFHSFVWASGGCFNDFYIHIVDHLCWMKDAWPVKAQAVGARHYKTAKSGNPYVDQNFDNYSVEYTFADGTKMHMDGRCINGAERIYSSHAHGTKGMATLSSRGDCGLPSSIFSGQIEDPGKMSWQSKVDPRERNPKRNEWNDLIYAIRNDKPFNETERGVYASLTSSLGRIAAHTGKEWTLEKLLNSEHEYAPGADKWTADSPAPLKSDSNGMYPVPQPGVVTDREY